MYNKKTMKLNELNEEEIEYFESLEISHKKEFAKTPSIFQLMEWYPEAKQVALKNIRLHIKQYKKEIENVLKFQSNFLEKIYPVEIKKNILEATNNKEWIQSLTTRKVEEYKKEIDKLEKDKKYVLSLLNPTKKNQSIITPEIIYRVKQIPITDFIQVNRLNKTICLFHNDKNPSMHIYKESNSYHCFSCQSHGSVIDIIMKLQNIDFIGAVNYLYEKIS